MASNKAKLLILSALMTSVVSTAASAHNHGGEITLEAGRIFFDDPLEDDTTWGIGFGFPVNENWTIEAFMSKYDTETEAGAVDLDGTQYHIDGIYNVTTSSAWKPYLALGIGDLERDWTTLDKKDRETMLNLGGGVKRSLGGNWEFRTDLRAFNSLDNEYTDLVVNLGVSYLFGNAPAPVSKPAPAAAVVAPAVVAEKDTDGDGVMDSKDQCADTPKTHKVDAVGCSLKLTETVAIELNITFDSAKSIIKPEFDSEVAKLATFMNQYADTVVTVEGHTDSQGADVYNQKLSQSRADAVKASLITKYGISADRVKAIGYGEAKPIADNATAAGREQNRRVVGQVSTAVTTMETRQ